MVEFLITGPPPGSHGSYPVIVASVAPGVVLPVSASVSVGTVTVGTILHAPLVTVQGTVVADPTIQQQATSTFVKTNAALTESGAATLLMGSLQDLVADYVFGAAVSGSVQPWIADVEEQTGFKTGTIVSGGWFGGTVQGGHRLVVSGPVGMLVAVAWTVASGGTVGVGTITQVFITATPSTTG